MHDRLQVAQLARAARVELLAVGHLLADAAELVLGDLALRCDGAPGVSPATEGRGIAQVGDEDELAGVREQLPDRVLVGFGFARR